MYHWEGYRVRVLNAARGVALADRAGVADTARSRRRGLLGSVSLGEGEGLVLMPCRQVHTFGMRYPIDAVFVDAGWTVVRVVRNLRPQRLSPLVWRARAVLEVPAGTAERTGTAPGDRLLIIPCSPSGGDNGEKVTARGGVPSGDGPRRRRTAGRIIDL